MALCLATKSVAFEELWGWDRLLPYDLVLEDPSDLPMYESYLEQFYNLNSGAASDHYNSKAAADAALKVIKVTACLPACLNLACVLSKSVCNFCC